MSTLTSAQLQNLMLPHVALLSGEQQSDSDLRRQPWSRHTAGQTFALDLFPKKKLHWVNDVIVKPCVFLKSVFFLYIFFPYQRMELEICYVILTVLVGYIGSMGLSNLDVFKCQMYLATKVLCSHVFQQMQPPSTLKWFLEKQMHDEATTKVFAWLLLVDRLDYTTNISRTKKKLLQGTNKTTRISAIRIWKKWRST